MRNPISLQPSTASQLQFKLTSPRIVVKKAERRLFLYDGNKLVKTYRIGLGLSPKGDKVRQGDRRTPEGDFYIFTRNDKSAFYLSLGVSYPNAPHADRGLRDGLISKSQHDTIMRALKLKKTPPQNTALGGDIYIHGRGAEQRLDLGLCRARRTTTSANFSMRPPSARPSQFCLSLARTSSSPFDNRAAYNCRQKLSARSRRRFVRIFQSGPQSATFVSHWHIGC